MAIPNPTTQRNFLDMLTTAAQQAPSTGAPAVSVDTSIPPDPATLAQLTSGAASLPATDRVPPTLAPSQTPVTDASTQELESERPSAVDTSVAANQQDEKNDNPGFLSRLGRYASGFFGLSDDTPQAQRGAEIADVTGRISRGITMAAGTPEQKEIAEQQAEMPLKVAQLKALTNYRTGELQNRGDANAIKYATQFDPNSAEGQKAAAGTEVAGARTGNLNANTAKTQYELEILKQGQFPVDPVTAQLVGRPDLAGKAVSPLLWKSFQGVLNAKGLKPVDLGADGYWVLDRAGNKVNQISSISPSVARAQAYGQYRPVEVLNPNTGNAEYQYAGNAIASGSAPLVEGSKIMSKDAQFKDIYSGIGTMRQAINGLAQEPLDAPTIAKLTLATRETDPTVAHQIIDTVLGSEQLTPSQQDFVVALQQLNERALSLRNLAGMGNASDSMRAAIRATLPTAKSGDISLMRKQLDSVTNLVDNLYTGVPNIKRSAPSQSNSGSSVVPTHRYNPVTGKIEDIGNAR